MSTKNEHMARSLCERKRNARERDHRSYLNHKQAVDRYMIFVEMRTVSRSSWKSPLFFYIRNQLHHLMLRSPFDFAFVLFVVSYVTPTQINSEDHFNLTGSLGHACSNESSCSSPLVCSNISRCVCPHPSFVFWNGHINTCLYCSTGWIPWANGQCLFAFISAQSGEAYNGASSACSIQAAQLLQMHDEHDMHRLQHLLDQLPDDSEIIRLVNEGVWIDAIFGELETLR